MKIIKALLLILLILVILAVAILLWFRLSPETKTKNTLTSLVTTTQVQYFCRLIYPQISNCVKFNADQCPAIVNEQISPCIENAVLEGGSSAKSLQNAIDRCISSDMQQKLLNKYFNNTPECRRRFDFIIND